MVFERAPSLMQLATSAVNNLLPTCNTADAMVITAMVCERAPSLMQLATSAVNNLLPTCNTAHAIVDHSNGV